MPELRYYQKEAVEALFDFYQSPRDIGADGKPERKNALVCLPTGTGKSLVIADFLQRAFKAFPATRAIMTTHVKTLIRQNAAKMQEAWPLAPLGIYSAGLKSADSIQPIIFGGIQSCVGKFPKFGVRDFLIIDEAHLVGDDGSYLKFINELLMLNPYLKVIGLSATAYRLGLGCLTNGKIFTDIVYDKCNIEGFNELIAAGYLCPLIPKRTNVEIDVSGVGMSKGEYIQGDLEKAIREQDITYRALQEIVAHGVDRKSWLVFATGIADAEAICDCLNGAFGISTVVMHSKRTAKENDEAERMWKAGEVRCAVNMGMLTTGVDHPPLDLIGMMRPTMSTGLWVQMLGRGTRPYEGKSNCLVLDFAGNTRRLGPINDPVIPKMRGSGPPGDAPVRICPACACYNHASAKVCLACGEEFTFESKLSGEAGTAELLRSDLPQVETVKVDRVVYSPHVGKQSQKSSVKVSYYCGFRTFYEWITVEGIGGRISGRDWFRQRHASEPPASNAEVLALMGELRSPKELRVWMNHSPHPRVMAAEF